MFIFSFLVKTLQPNSQAKIMNMLIHAFYKGKQTICNYDMLGLVYFYTWLLKLFDYSTLWIYFDCLNSCHE